ncbi:hypothetical protein ACWKWU_00480 [Chitinophaga lutea]
MQFETIAQLKLQPGLPSPDNSAQVLGYHVPNDGGGGFFYWDAAATDPEDGGLIFATPNSTGRWKRLYNGAVFLDWFGADNTGNTDAATQFTDAIAVLKQMGSGELVLSGTYRFDNPLTLNDLDGITISGGTAANILDITPVPTVMVFDHAPANTGCISISKFVNLNIRDISIVNNRENESTAVLELYNGYDFSLENVKILSTLGPPSIGIKLGRGTGELCAFNGILKNCRVRQVNGGTSFESNYTNTSLLFQSCYSMGGSYAINGTVYSSLVSCACDGSNTDGYIVRGSDLSNSNTLSFISCGAEACQYSGFKIESGSINIQIMSPHSGGNNKAGRTDIGDVLTLERTNTGLVESVVISTPTSAAAHTSTTANIVGGPGVGKVSVISYEPATLTKGFGGDLNWLKDWLTIISPQGSRLHNLTLSSPVRTFTLEAEYEAAGFETSYKSVSQLLQSAANEFYFYPGSPQDGYILPNSRIKGMSLRLDTDITSTDGGTIMDLIAVDAYTQRKVIYENVPMVKNTKLDLFNENGLFPVTEQNTLGFILQLRNNKTFAAGAAVTAVVYYECFHSLATLP